MAGLRQINKKTISERVSKIPLWFSGIKRRWLFNNISVVLVVLLLVFFFVSVGSSSYYNTSLLNSLETRANTTAKYLNRYMAYSYEEFYNYSSNMTTEFSEKDKLEMQIIDAYGRVMFSSTGLTTGFIPSTSDVSDCLNTRSIVTYSGYDPLTGEKIAAATAPIFYQNGQLVGAVRYVSSQKLLQRQLGELYLLLAGAGVFVLGLLFISNQYFIRSIVNPVLKINELASRITSGQYGAQIEMNFHDEIGELAETINHMSSEIARMEKLKNDFISSVSHELRTPLTAIGGWTETIAHDLGDPVLANQGLAIIQKETLRLSQIVEELLNFSRLESGSFKLQTEVFDLRGQLYDSVFTYKEMLRQEGLEVNYDEGDEELLVLGDKNRLKQVFLNIIDNGAKYGKDGKVLDITAKRQGDDCVVVIRDYGAGIPANELPFVKEKFFKGSNSTRGTGIGLAVCDEIIELHGGHLEINSVYGEGTEVIIVLPAVTREII